MPCGACQARHLDKLPVSNTIRSKKGEEFKSGILANDTTSNDTSSNTSNNNNNTGMIVAVVLASIAFLFILAFICYRLYQRRKTYNSRHMLMTAPVI